ncbi:HalOD1 output domain-containing protein [Haloarcula amylovorans]|uniref:HalOD1 output domain-containing protein n=1 Tax=Haloarcula amylovorans TaxID=2562280 RepID=UPI001076A5C9|nr:HalOD1 output domain-containing protein [Halomicroarcula amylolytica]
MTGRASESAAISLMYVPTADCHYATVDRPGAMSDVVTLCVAHLHGFSCAELPPLSNILDPTALDTLFADENTCSSCVLTFEYCGYAVTVDSPTQCRFSRVGASD